jgi:hypothetical protein
LERLPEQVYVAEVDTESVKYLKEHYPILAPRFWKRIFCKLILTAYQHRFQ